MLRFPNAKINLGLYVTEKRPDGFHNLETIFVPIPLRDALEILPESDSGNSALIQMSGLEMSGDPKDNLIWKAYKMLENDFPDKVKPLDIFLHKCIPMGAGLGGGSADAVMMLQMMNDFFDLNIENKLPEYALRLGSDCPFFLRNKPSFAKGRGEELYDIDLDLEEYTIRTICPDLSIATAQAFQGIKPKKPNVDLRDIADIDISEWKNHVFNDFEQTIFRLHPELQDLKNELYRQGAIYASMSGTGSTIYGIFKKGAQTFS